MRRGSSMLAGIAASLLFQVSVVAAESVAQTPAKASAKPRQLALSVKPWQGDFEQMIERRMIRVLVPYSRTLYFNDRGRERGITADTVREFERYLNRKYAAQLGKRPLTVYIIPTTRDKLLSGVIGGLGDIAVGNLTITDERRQLTDFVAIADQKPVSEIVLTGTGVPELTSPEALSGRIVHVRPSSSYHDSLEDLNEQLKKAGKAPVKIVLVPDALEDEDMMEMLDAGLLEAIIVDDWKARMWAQVLPKIKLHPQAVVRSGGQIGWAVRKGSPQLVAALDDFFTNDMKKSNITQQLVNTYTRRVKQFRSPAEEADRKRFEETIGYFRKYGSKYDFDPLMLAAQGFQESQLDQNARSHVGAIGIMQIMPTTGSSLGVGSIHVTESNIHAGTKYMDQLMSKYFPDAKFSESNRPLFAFASYNAGPGNISKMRKEAAKRGLDPDKWFNNVEIVVAEKIGKETTTYVRNIYKYYAAYRLTQEAEEASRQSREKVSPGGK
ncbi:MAG: transporter substrate-binding domain-containing protein [Azonexus sp.]